MHDPNRNTLAAALLGASAGMRTVTPEAVLILRGRMQVDPKVRQAVLIAAAAELVADKLPFVPSRTRALPYLGRVLSGAFCGLYVDGQTGALTAAAAGAATTTIGHQARKLPKTKKSAFFAALLEDAFAIGVANLALVVAGD